MKEVQKSPAPAKPIPKTSKTEFTTDPEKVPQKKSVFLLWFLNYITCGIYCPIWYLKRTPELNNLGTQRKLNRSFPFALLILEILTIGLFIAFPITLFQTDMGSFGLNFSETQLMVLIGIGVTIALQSLLILFLAFYTKSAIDKALENKGEQKISGIFTLLFNFLYLQYEINRIVEDREHEPKKGPWIWLIIFIVFTGIGLIVSLFSS